MRGADAVQCCTEYLDEGGSMLETMDKSSGNMVGYKVVGDMTKADYATLDPAVDSVIKEYGSINLLLDLTGFRWEKVNAWSTDLNFGKTYKDKIDKMALVGNQKWEKAMAKAAQPFYAKEIQYFETDDDAWDWLNS
jgi:hypothetical protein